MVTFIPTKARHATVMIAHPGKHALFTIKKRHAVCDECGLDFTEELREVQRNIDELLSEGK